MNFDYRNYARGLGANGRWKIAERRKACVRQQVLHTLDEG